MIFLNINEGKWYSHKGKFAEEVINDMFKEYFEELYQEDAVKWRIDEIWEQISIKIPKRAVFVEKDSILYSVTSDLEFKVAPEDFFEIDEVSHPVLIKCFEKCYPEFKKMMKNYRDWDGEENRNLRKKGSIANIHLGTSMIDVPKIEYLSNTLNNIKCKFGQILQVSLKPKMCDELTPKIVELYKNTLLQNNPIMLITKVDYRSIKIYAVTDNLEVEEVTYSLMERELEEIIHEVVPEDTDFLVNRIYNLMILPFRHVQPCIRINKVQDTGLINATLFLKENDIPVVCDYKLEEFYTFLKITHDEGFPIDKFIRYHNDMICAESMEPNSGMKELQRVNQTMFDEMSCYVEYPGQKYTSSWDCDDPLGSTPYSRLYKLEDGIIQEVYEHRHVHIRGSEYTRFKKIMEEEGENAESQGTYAFWKITFKENE